MPYQLNAALLERSGAKIMHDLPINRASRVSAVLVESECSIICDQA